MWIAKFKNWHKTCLIRPLCVKYNVTDYVYLLNHWHKGKTFYYTELHILEGSKKNVKKFISEFQKDKTIKKFEVDGNQIFTLNALKGEGVTTYSSVFDTKLIYIKPVIQRIDGYEDWELASWDKETLMNIMKIPDFDMELIYVKEVKGANLFLPQIQPNLSEKQRESISIAIKNGYYNFPRGKDLNELSAVAKVSKQTFQENLRKAENKLIPFLVDNLK